MTPEQWRQIEEIFNEALEKPAEERESFVGQACAADQELKQEVLRLLAAEQPSAGFLERTIRGGLDLIEGEELVAAPLIGPYRLLRRIGYGGMGEVYLAERADQEYKQRVAIKLMRPGLAGRHLLGRFRRERQILASLEHPNIARLLDGGTTPDGRPYLVMEYIDGLPIDQDCDRRRLGLRARLKLFQTVCRAVQFAHQHLVVHRDLKPSNILITREGEVKLLDFGIAKLLQPEKTAHLGEATLSADHPLTLSYASPEQVRGERITVASDVYSLGVVLYVLLTGSKPFDFGEVAPKEAVRLICEEKPGPPSTKIDAQDEDATLPSGANSAAVSRARRERPERLRRRLQGDLDTILLTALAKEPQRRYGSAELFSQDIERHLTGLPVLARPDRLSYRTIKFVARNKWRLLVASAFFVLLTASWWSRSRQAEQTAQERDKAQLAVDFLVELFSISDPDRSRGETITARELLDAGAARIDRELEGQPLVRATLSNTVGRVYRELGLYDRARPLLTRALNVRQEELAPEHLDIAESLANWGGLLHVEGNYEEAERALREALEMYTDLLGEDRQEVADVRRELALVLWKQARNQQAEALLRSSLEVYRNLFGDKHRSVAEASSNLAMVLEAQGKYDEAEKLMRRASELSREIYGDPHPVVAEHLNNLAFQLETRGEYARAEPLYREALAMRKMVYGPTHPDVQQSRNNLAALLFQQGDFPASEALFHEALELARSSLGDDHPDVASIRNNLAVVSNRQGDFLAAERLLREVLLQRQKQFGQEHPEVAKSLDNLAAQLFTVGKYEEAEPLYEQALALRRRLLDADHPAIAKSLSNLALLQSLRGNLQSALQLQQQALDIQRRSWGEEHPKVASSLARLGRFYAEDGALEQAQELFRQAIAQQRRLLDADHPDLASSLTGLGEVLHGLGEHEEAQELLRVALTIRHRALPENHWRISETESALGECLGGEGQLEEAARLLRSGHANLERKRGADNYLTRKAAQRLRQYE